MGFVINTNVNALIANTSNAAVGRDLSSSLNKLSSGLRINKAADDASGMAIADSLRSQAKGLNQAVRNANDAIGIIQIADKAMDEQIKILDTVRSKSIQSAQDGQTTASRKALQSDIIRLLEELDLIASSTSYNGKSLLSGGFTNKKFQIGAYSNQTVNTSIGATSTDKIGQTRFETGAPITGSSMTTLKLEKVDGVTDITLEGVIISSSTGTGIGALAEVINKNSNELQARAKFEVRLTSQNKVGPQDNPSDPSNPINDVLGLEINGVSLGDIYDIQPDDKDARLVAAVNNVSADTGVRATISPSGALELTTADGRGIKVAATSGFNVLGITQSVKNADDKQEYEYYGRLTLIRNDARDIIVSNVEKNGNSGSASSVGFSPFGKPFSPAESVVNLRSIKGTFNRDQASAIGNHPNFYTASYKQSLETNQMPTGVTTFIGAQTVIDVSDTAIKMLDAIRADLGSVQIQLEAIVNNSLATRSNVKFSESQIRDADYSSEITNFQKSNILAQAGNYALSKSNEIQQGVLQLLK